MPDLDGRDVLRRLKDDPETRDVPVVIVTSSRLNRTESEQLSRLATAIVSKDVLTPAVVADAVRHALNRSAKVANG
jgi:putative two-component system response regulator